MALLERFPDLRSMHVSLLQINHVYGVLPIKVPPFKGVPVYTWWYKTQPLHHAIA